MRIRKGDLHEQHEGAGHDRGRRGILVKTAVVTGGASGIGLGIAKRLSADGYHVATLDLNPSGADEGSPDAAAGFAQSADVTDRARVSEALAAVRERLGPIAILINAAGKEGHKRFTDLTFEAWQRMIDVNLNGTFHCIKAALPDMLEAGWGRIVNISSSSAQSGQAFLTHYVAAKSAVEGLTKALALELGPFGITVNAVPPGFVDTPMLRRVEARNLIGGTIEEHIQRTPVRRVGRPEDVAAACAFLVSEDASYITGQIIGVNGGRNT
jgi:NAD(P)-dependent dehydrogenase (short-subunit alcohol dehydrogenase family)